RGRPRDYVIKDQRRWYVFGLDDYRQPSQPELSNKYKPFDREVYLQCVKILRRVDGFLDQQDIDNVQKRNVRFYLARYISCVLTNNAYCPPADLAACNPDTITDAQLQEGLREVLKVYNAKGGGDEAAKNTDMTMELDSILIAKYSPPHNPDTLKRKKSKRAKA